MLLLYPIAIGLLIGRLAGGRLAALERVRFDWWPLALGGLAFQALLFGPLLGPRVGDAAPALYVLSTGLVLAAALRNVRLPGFALITAGALLNLMAIVANGGWMPSSPEARMLLNGSLELPHAWTNSIVAGPATPLALLGDILVLPRPIPFANAFSIGDVLIGIGTVLFVVRSMRSGVAPGGRGGRGAADPSPTAAVALDA